MRLNGTVTQPIPPQQPVTPPGTYPPPGANPPPYPAAKKSYVGLIIGILVAFFVLLAGVGVGGYFVYRAVGDDHCGTVADAAASAVTSAMSFDSGTTKESYLDRNRDQWTPGGFARLQQLAGTVDQLQKLNPTAVNVRVVDQTVKECRNGNAKVLLVLRSSAKGAGSYDTTTTTTATMQWIDGKWLAADLNVVN
jgi:hypothetical protein